MARNLILTCLGIVLVVAACNTVFAHDGSFNVDFTTLDVQTVLHEDADPWKGWALVGVTNSTDDDWAGFHFEIASCDGIVDISNVAIVDVYPYEPTTSRIPFSYVVDNVAVGATLDYSFTNPVTPGQMVTFQFYTDNTTDKVNFCLAMCPTPVPEPATLGLLGVGLFAMLLTRRRK